MPALPDINAFIGAAVTEGEFKTALIAMHGYLSDLLGDEGTQSSAQAALGVDTVGMVAYFAHSAPPVGWLKCNGDLVSRAEYASLFDAIGTTYGAGDGATTFRLPDLRGEFVRGFDDGRGVDSGRALGSAQSDMLKSHSHTTVVPVPESWRGNVGTTIFGGTPSFAGGYNTGSTGGAETRPRNLAMLACIKY